MNNTNLTPSTGRQTWFNGPDTVFCLSLLVVLVVYATHLFSFTVFEGYATLSSDSFSYIRQALLWSPYSQAPDYAFQTLPEHLRAPGWSWVLALSGGAESTYRAHLVVSVLLLLSIAVAGWMAYRAAGLTVGLWLTITFCLLPGSLVSSLGILSENLYLFASLCTLMIIALISRPGRPPTNMRYLWALAVLACLLLAILTRSIGLALALAMVVAALGNAGWAGVVRVVVGTAGLLGFAAWTAWDAMGTDSGLPGEYSYFVSIFTGGEQSLSQSFSILRKSVLSNAASLAAAWNHYLNSTHHNPLFFAASFLALAAVMVCTALRAAKLKPDALYVLGYLSITLLWPYPQGMLRFLHPLVMLMFLQPVLLLAEHAREHNNRRNKWLLLTLLAIVMAGSASSQLRMLEFRHDAERHFPGIEHSPEYYQFPHRAAAIDLPLLWQATLKQMKEAAGVVPEGSTVATIKHEAFMLVAGRRAVMLTSLVPYPQQVCNFLLQDVDFVFLSQMNSSFVPHPFGMVDEYSAITGYVLTMTGADGQPRAHVLRMDKQAYRPAISAAGATCHEVVLQ